MVCTVHNFASNVTTTTCEQSVCGGHVLHSVEVLLFKVWITSVVGQPLVSKQFQVIDISTGHYWKLWKKKVKIQPRTRVRSKWMLHGDLHVSLVCLTSPAAAPAAPATGILTAYHSHYYHIECALFSDMIYACVASASVIANVLDTPSILYFYFCKKYKKIYWLPATCIQSHWEFRFLLLTACGGDNKWLVL